MASPDTPRTSVADGPGNATIASGKRALQLATQNVQPPSPLYLQIEDSINVQWSIPTLALPVTGEAFVRWLRPDGEIVSVRKLFQITSPVAGYQFTLGEGFLLSITISLYSVAVPDPGVAFFDVLVQRDLPEFLGCFWQLFSDYYTSAHLPSWPNGRTINAQEGPGHLRSITGTTPAAGAEISETVPANVRWRLIMGNAVLTCSANVANRNISFVIDDGVNILYRYISNTNFTAGSTGRHVFASQNLQGNVDASGQNLSIPDNLFLGAGYRFRTVTGGLQVNDQFSAPQYLVQEWVNI
jgi:hypothetical protein